MGIRSQPYRLKWPLTPSQVAGIDEMFAILFQASQQGGLPGPAGPVGPAGAGSTITVGNGLSGADGMDGEDGAPGPPGVAGAAGSQGPMGSMGAIIFPPDAEDGDIFPPIVGPQGNPGPTGAQGPVGPTILVEDGLDGEDGIPGPAGPAGASGGNLSSVRMALTNAQMKTWNSSPIQLVAAQGAGTMIIPLYISIEITIIAGAGNNPTLSVVYGTNTTNLLSSTLSTSLGSAGIQSNQQTAGAIQFRPYATYDPRNKAINLVGSADISGVSENVTSVVNLIYTVITTTT